MFSCMHEFNDKRGKIWNLELSQIDGTGLNLKVHEILLLQVSVLIILKKASFSDDAICDCLSVHENICKIQHF